MTKSYNCGESISSGCLATIWSSVNLSTRELFRLKQIPEKDEDKEQLFSKVNEDKEFIDQLVEEVVARAKMKERMEAMENPRAAEELYMNETEKLINHPPFSKPNDTSDCKENQEQATLPMSTSESTKKDNRPTSRLRAELVEPLDELHLPLSLGGQLEGGIGYAQIFCLT